MERLMGYIDFDGVILDTETGLFDQYRKLKSSGIEISAEQYLTEMDWNAWIDQAAIINNSIEILKNNPPQIAPILTKIHSFEEGKAKLSFLRRKDVKNDVILVPHICKKHEIVNPAGKFLVDNFGENLRGWQNNGGISIRFTVDSKKSYTDYFVVSSLAEVFKMINYK